MLPGFRRAGLAPPRVPKWTMVAGQQVHATNGSTVSGFAVDGADPGLVAMGSISNQIIDGGDLIDETIYNSFNGQLNLVFTNDLVANLSGFTNLRINNGAFLLPKKSGSPTTFLSDGKPRTQFAFDANGTSLFNGFTQGTSYYMELI